jgi:hypothetical protein
MRVVAADRLAGERATPGLKWSGVELDICIGSVFVVELGWPPLGGGDLHGFSILKIKKSKNFRTSFKYVIFFFKFLIVQLVE